MSASAASGPAASRPAAPGSVASGPVTAGTVLFGDAGPARAAATSRGWRAAVGTVRGALGTGVAAAGVAIVESQLSATVSALLGLNIGDILVDAWRGRGELDAAARATQHDPQASTVVPLASHRVLSSHKPSVDLVLNGTRVATLGFDLGIMVDVESASVTVRHAHLVRIHSGRFTVKVGLSFAGHDVAVRVARLDPATTITLRRPVPLLRKAAEGQASTNGSLR